LLSCVRIRYCLQVAQIMRQQHIEHFSKIAERATRARDTNELLVSAADACCQHACVSCHCSAQTTLARVALLVRGRWVVKSNLVNEIDCV
jgi:hypothetical protein